MKPSEIIRKDAIRNKVDPDRLLNSIHKQLSDKTSIMLQSGDSVLILKKISEGKVELHLFTVESPKALMRSLKFFIDKIVDRKSTRLNSSHMSESRMPSSA
mgnify:CR=1 FL=1